MVIDTSALLAIFLREAERQKFLELMTQAETKLISAANVLEAGIVLEARRGDAAGRELDLFLRDAQLQIVAADAEQIEIARAGWRKYGRGRHRACLNFGDCFSYALAKLTDEPLLFKGEDFKYTDITPVIS